MASGGTVEIDFAIGLAGEVTSAAVRHSSFSKPEIGRCVVKTLYIIQFPMPADMKEVHVTYPFRF